MYLKSLTLKGFKSFAEPASLVFEPGVTVVVGPNGSGKSNVVDAVAWVLGAQGPRTVRGSKMEDVIFAGSASRPALGRAEVSLTIDNRSGKLPGGLAEITITRTLFRSGDSEYAINGESCRLLDVQELLSDSGVGRQQHVIVGQGQLEQVLNARPEDRRAVIEDAAGVLKHRRRRERAERRLAATEENLDRLGDLVREVRRQLRPLERQAAAARSHSSLSEELHGLRLYLMGRDIAGIDQRAGESEALRVALVAEDERLGQEIERLDREIDGLTISLSARREEDVQASLNRVEGLTERCRGLAGALRERRRSVSRALEAAVDADVVSSLESEAARIAEELTGSAEEESALAADHQALEQAERAVEVARSQHEQLTADLERLREVAARHAASRAQMDPLSRALDAQRDSLAQVGESIATLSERRELIGTDAEELAEELAELDAGEATNAEMLEEASSLAETLEAQLAEAEGRLRLAERDRNRLEARAEALARAAAEARGAAGAEVLSGIEGVVGTLADLVEVDEGWAAAFEAAVGAALGAVVVDGTRQARQALAHLRTQQAPGAVLALAALSSWPLAAPASLPPGAEALRPHVRSLTPSLDAVLDRILAPAVLVSGGWEMAVDVAASRPDLVVVTPEGDRFATSGWRLHGAEGTVSRHSVEEARRQADAAATLALEAAGELELVRSRESAARADLVAKSRLLDEAGSRRRQIEALSARLASESESLEREMSALMRRREETALGLEQAEAALASHREALAVLEREAAQAREGILAAAESERHLMLLRERSLAMRRDYEVRAAALGERRRVLSERLLDVERRLAGHVAERDQAAENRRALEAEMAAVDRLGELVADRARRLGEMALVYRQLRDRQLDEVRAQASQLDSLRAERQELYGLQSAAREKLAGAKLALAEDAVRREALVDMLWRELKADPEEAVVAERPELPEGVSAQARAAEIETQLAALGPVNPLALEELQAIEERHQLLQEQVEDVRRARREIQEVIRNVDDEVTRMFSEAFADVNEHFSDLVATLFPGGTGRLTLTDPGDPLNTGVEVEVRPLGKNVRKLSLLSGGERSLVALAFLFAVFRSRPSPFYLMDEVEAALDDVNLHRFLDLLHAFRHEAQLIVVSHQKRTMESADALYGVTMRPGDSSRVVSQKVPRKQPDDVASEP